MEIFLLLFLLIILALPTILMSRRQRAKMAEIQKLQDALQPGDRVVTTAGLHAVVVSVSEEQVELEIAPGVVTSWEKMSIVRVVQPVMNPELHQDSWHTQPGQAEGTDAHPQVNRENLPDTHPENFRDTDGDDRPSGAPETR